MTRRNIANGPGLRHGRVHVQCFGSFLNYSAGRIARCSTTSHYFTGGGALNGMAVLRDIQSEAAD